MPKINEGSQSTNRDRLRHDFTRDEVRRIYEQPLTRLVARAAASHARYFNEDEIQLSTLLSIKTGGCREDCSYCSQSAHHKSGLQAEPLLDVDSILKAARAAKDAGSNRFCMGAAWRSPPKKGPAFDRVLAAIRGVRDLEMEVCVTLGMLDEEQAGQLREAGVDYYNHNLDTSPEYYGKVISTRTYDDRLATLRRVRQAGMAVCCGGIIGMGEGREDRIGLLCELAALDPHPESVPVNMLVAIKGTPLEDQQAPDSLEMVRTIATAKILMPASRIRLSAGRESMSDELQALCIIAGASSFFTGDKLLTTPNAGDNRDRQLLDRMGLHPVAGTAEKAPVTEAAGTGPEAATSGAAGR